MSKLDARARGPRTSSRAMLIIAATVAVIIGRFVPHGQTILYPLTLLATWVHEMGHGLAALLVGGGFDRLEIFADASGLAHTRHLSGVPAAVVALGGLIAPPLVGALVLLFARGPRRARVVLLLLGLALVLSALVFVRSVAGLVAVPLLGLLLGAVVRFGGGREQMFVAQFAALHLALDSMGRGLSYLFTDTVLIDGQQRMSDVAAVAQGFGGPRLLFSIAISALCVLLVVLGLLGAFRAERDPAPSGS